MIDLQSSATGLLPCPFGTLENSPAIYGWGHPLTKNQSPGGTAEPPSRCPQQKNGSSTRKKFILSKSPCFLRLCGKKVEFAKPTHFVKSGKSMPIIQKHKSLGPFWPKKRTHFLKFGCSEKKVEIAKRTQFALQAIVIQ